MLQSLVDMQRRFGDVIEFLCNLTVFMSRVPNGYAVFLNEIIEMSYHT